MKKLWRPMLMSTLALVAAPWTEEALAGDELVVDSVLVRLIEQVEVPAREAGAIVELAVHEGDQVEEGSLVARVEDDEAVLAAKRARAELAISEEKAGNDVGVRFTKKAWEVAKAELRRATEAVEKYKQSIPQSEIDRIRLTAEKTALEIEQAEHQQQVERLTRDQKQVELDYMSMKVQKRQINAPLSGVVVAVNVQRGEWVEPGQKVARIVRTDRLRAEGFVHVKELTGPIIGQPASLKVDLPGRSGASFPGKVTFVSPEVDPVNGQVRVWVEVDNTEQALRPGLKGRLTIPRESKSK